MVDVKKLFLMNESIRGVLFGTVLSLLDWRCGEAVWLYNEGWTKAGRGEFDTGWNNADYFLDRF